MPETRSAEDRLVAALAPGPDALDRVRTVIAKFAAELADVDLLDMVAAEVEHPTGLSAADVVERAGISYRQLDHWTAVRYVRAVVDRPGSGNLRSYHPREVVKARVMGALVNVVGIKASIAADLAEEIIRTGTAHVGEFTIVRDAS